MYTLKQEVNDVENESVRKHYLRNINITVQLNALHKNKNYIIIKYDWLIVFLL